jgi:fructokinase
VRGLVSVGEALMDLKGDSTSGAFRTLPGGSPFNVAIGAARLGVPAAFLGSISADSFGAELAERLTREGVDAARCPRVQAPTTIALVMEQGGEPHFLFYAHDSADAQLRPEHVEGMLAEPPAILHVGSYSLCAEPAGSTIEGLVEALAGRSLIALDPNIRPFFADRAPGIRQRLERLIARTDLVKLSRQDSRWLYRGLSDEQVVAELLRAGPVIAVVTRGADGVNAGLAPDRYDLPGERVEVVDTVGCGDAFSAAFEAGLLTAGARTRADLGALAGEPFLRLLERANAAAAVNATRPGADPPRPEEVEALLAL